MTKWQKFWLTISLGALAIIATSIVRAGPVLAWSPVTTYVDGTPIPASLQSQLGYAVYSKPCGSTANATRLNMPLLIFATTYTWQAAPGCYTLTVTSDLQAQESVPSNPLDLTVAQFPGIPGGVTATSTLTTQTTIAYVPVLGHDRLTFLIVGTVPLGTKCDATQPDGPFFVVPAASVTVWQAPYTATNHPTTVVGACS